MGTGRKDSGLSGGGYKEKEKRGKCDVKEQEERQRLKGSPEKKDRYLMVS